MSTECPHPLDLCFRTQSIRLKLRFSMVTGLICLALCGCNTSFFSGAGQNALTERFSSLFGDKNTRSYRRENDEDNDFGRRYETPLLNEFMSVQGDSVRDRVVLKGVGLVTGLDGEGGDPSPSGLRTQLQNEMSRRKVANPNSHLASRDTALVVVIAYLPSMIRKNEPFDVRVVLPPNSNARSLKGGWLLETRLFEEHTVQNTTSLRPQEYAVAGGAILTDLLADNSRSEKQASLMSGTIPGGALSKVDRDLSIVLRNDKRGARNSERIARAVSGRFHRYNRYGQKITCAKAKSDLLVELKSHPQYVNNFARYRAVIGRIAMSETDVARRMRIEMLSRDILKPGLCEEAALQLEAIGEEAVPYLRDALASDSIEVQFNAAQSLAYLEDPSGVGILKQLAENEPAFRIYALVALSVLKDDPDAILALRELMSSESLETRYGALRSLKELDPTDPFLATRAFENRFEIHEIDSTGEPMVHVTRRRLPEIAIFGKQQQLRLPCVLNAGDSLRVIGRSGGSSVEVTKYKLNREPERFQIGNRLSDILNVCSELGATYPELVQLLVEANAQHNLTGEFGMDRLPQSGRKYRRTELGTQESGTGTELDPELRIGFPQAVPQLFDELDEKELARNESAEKLESLDFSEVARKDSRSKSGRSDTTLEVSDTQDQAGVSAELQRNNEADFSEPDPSADERFDSGTDPERESPPNNFSSSSFLNRLNPFRRDKPVFDGLTEPE